MIMIFQIRIAYVSTATELNAKVHLLWTTTVLSLSKSGDHLRALSFILIRFIVVVFILCMARDVKSSQTNLPHRTGRFVSIRFNSFGGIGQTKREIETFHLHEMFWDFNDFI